MSEKIIRGVPSTVLLPSLSNTWEHVSGPHAVDVFGKDMVKFALAADLDVVIDLGQVTKSLFSANLYPELKSNEVFSVRNVIIEKDKDRVTIIGNVLKRL